MNDDTVTPEKRPACTACGSRDVLPIEYGEMLVDPDIPEDELDFVEGGCVEIPTYSPQWHCRGCGREWRV